MNVDGVITSIANQLVEVLKVPAQIAWQAGQGYVRLSGWFDLIPMIVSAIFLLLVSGLLLKLQQKEWTARVVTIF